MDAGALSILSLGFGLGLVHALDADHVMAVSSLAARRPGLRGSLGVSLRWAAGHAAVLVLVCLCVHGAGLRVPEAGARAAEALAGAVLVALGIGLALDLRRRGGHLHFHRHDGTPPHAHWHVHDDDGERAPAHQHSHTPVWIGALHGLAGSAPLLALLPAAGAGSAVLGLAYAAVFSLGVASAMALCSGALGTVAGRLAQSGDPAPLRALRSLVALGSIAVGVAMWAPLL